MSAQAVRSGERLMGDEAAAVSGEAKTTSTGRTTAPPPMSQEEYESLVRSSPPPGPLDLAARDLDEDFGAGAPTRPPAAHRSESLPDMSAWQRASSKPGWSTSRSSPAISSRRGVGLTAPSRRNSDLGTGYSMPVPRAPPVPALTIPNMPATHLSSDAVVSTERPTQFGARAQLEDRSAILRHAIAPTKVTDLPIDHRAGFLLSLIDGKATIEELLDMCPMPEEDVLSVLANLVCRGVVVIGPASRR